MSNSLHNEIKKEFQLERLILFSDAVFAIAITLLVIEIKIPDVHEDISDDALLRSLGHLIPKFIGFLISFMLIGLYWSVHHRMFGFVTGYNRKLIVLNLLFLFFIVLMPFSTGFYSEYAGPDLFRRQLKVPMTFYVLNYVSAGIVNFLMWRYITNLKHGLTNPPIDSDVARFAKVRSLVVPCCFLMMLPVAYLVDVRIAVYIPMLIPAVLSISRRILMKGRKHH